MSRSAYLLSMKQLARLLPLGIVIVAAACGGGGKSEKSESSKGASGTPIKTITVNETEFKLDPSTVTLSKPGTYAFKAVNNGGTTHALEIEGNGLEEETENIAPGDSATLKVKITKSGDYELYCPVDNHRDKGMEGTVKLGSGGGGGETETGSTSSSGGGY